MINYKIEHKLTGSQHWPRASTVFVKGIPNEPNVSPEKSEQENEKIIQSWKNIAVLKATSAQSTPFYIGFYNQGVLSYLKHELRTNLYFGGAYWTG